jgi:hypothetical protein
MRSCGAWLRIGLQCDLFSLTVAIAGVRIGTARSLGALSKRDCAAFHLASLVRS